MTNKSSGLIFDSATETKLEKNLEKRERERERTNVIGGAGERDAIDGEEDVADGQLSSLPGGSVHENLLDAD